MSTYSLYIGSSSYPHPPLFAHSMRGGVYLPVYQPLNISHMSFLHIHTNTKKTKHTSPSTILKSYSHNKAFTLLEILLVVAIIAILAGIVIVAINPAKQLGTSRDAERKSDINTIYKAVNQYLIDKGSLTGLSLPTTATYICNSNSQPSGCIDLSILVPTYIPAIPNDPQATTSEGTGYQIAKVNSNVFIVAPDTEIGFTTQAGQASSTPTLAFIGSIPSGYSFTSPTGGSSGGGGSTPTVNYALQFDGSTQYITIPNNSAFFPSSLTAEAWIKTTATSGAGDIVGSYAGGNGWFLLLDANDSLLLFDVWVGNSQIFRVSTSSSAINDGAWHQVAATYDGSTAHLWVDGVSVDTASASATITSSGNPIIIGANYDLASYVNMTVDEVRISNNIRYTSAYTPAHYFGSDANTVALYHFDEGTGVTTADASGNGNTGTLVNSPTWVTR